MSKIKSRNWNKILLALLVYLLSPVLWKWKNRMVSYVTKLTKSS